MLRRLLLLVLNLSLCTACVTMSYSESPFSETTSPEPSEEIHLEVNVNEIPIFIDPLTGLSVSEAIQNCRPAAVVINNHNKARPQSGIGQAAICYEVLAEGNITRIIAIFHDFDAQKIGPVRSARHYFIDFALDYDAIFVHHGGSPQGYEAIEQAGIADLDGMFLSETFWRDPERVSIPGMYEHSSYTGEALIRQAQERFEFRTVIREGLNPGFLFYDEPVCSGADAEAVFIAVLFATGYGSFFEYRDGLYYKYMENEPQIDAETGEQLSVSNIIIQYAPISVIPGDTNGRRDVNVVGEGSGIFITNGGSTSIMWKKESHETPTRWYKADGGDLYFSRGKTWICVVSPDTAVSIEKGE